MRDITCVILTDRSDQIFLKSLQSARFFENFVILDYASGNDWSQLRQQLQLPATHFRVFPQPTPIHDFAAARNFALQKVQTPWVFFLDSDEIILSTPPAIMEQLLKQTNKVFQVKRQDIFQHQLLRFGETATSTPLRLAPTQAIHFKRRVHEVAHIQKGYKIAKSSLVLHHFAHQDLTEFFATICQYAQLEAQFRCLEHWPYSRTRIAIEMLCWPLAKFFVNYVLRLGFLDGFPGLVYAVMMSFHSLILRITLYEKYFL